MKTNKNIKTNEGGIYGITFNEGAYVIAILIAEEREKVIKAITITGAFEIWLPKSQIEINYISKDEAFVRIPKWLFIQKGLAKMTEIVSVSF